MKLENKTAIITGASRGIGRSTALLFAKEGANVVVNYFSSRKEALSIVEEIEKIGSRAIAIKCDVSKENEVKKMIDKTVDEFGEIDILVNNAGIVYRDNFLESSVDKWKKIYEVNLLGVFLCSKYVSKQMNRKNKIGKIVNISSTNGLDSFFPRTMAYDASKAGVNILTKNLAKELAPNIQVNAIAPGWVKTDMGKGLSKDFIKKEKKKVYLKRFAQPEEIAKSILFLASDDSSYITGSILKVDGGYN